MENIVIILGERTKDIKRTLDTHYRDSVRVVDAFDTPNEFAEKYSKTPLRADRIIIHESSLLRDRYTNIESIKSTLSGFNVKFKQCYILISYDKDIKELVDYLLEDDTFVNRNKVRSFQHELYTPVQIIEYCLDKIARRHFVTTETEFDDVVRVKRNADSTFKLDNEQEEEEEVRPSELIVLEKDSVRAKELNEKLKNLTSLSNLVENEAWENNRIFRDLLALDRIQQVGQQTKNFNVDYSTFHLKDKVKKVENNIFLVTGEKRSGKTTLTYALGKSASSANKRTLIVDLDFTNFGLSHLTETQVEYASVMLIQDFGTGMFKNALRTLVNSKTNLNVLASNSKTLTALNGIDPMALAQLIAYSCRKYFDVIVVDINFDNIDDCVELINNCEKLIFTVPNTMSCLYDLFNNMKDKGILKNYANAHKVVIPMDIFNKINGNSYLQGSSIKNLTKTVFGEELIALTNLEFKSFNLNEDLLKAIKAIGG